MIVLYADILRAIGYGARKSHIVYRANLSFSRCNRYLDDLNRMGLIRTVNSSPPKWAITEKGMEFLKNLRTLEDFLES